MIEAQVYGIGVDARWQRPVVLLRERTERHRLLPIWLAVSDARAMGRAHRAEFGRRPDTHGLIVDLMQVVGRRLVRVGVTDLLDGVFHGELLLDDGARVNARATDALTLALKAGVGIEVAAAVFDRAGVPDGGMVLIASHPAGTATEHVEGPQEETEQEIERFRRFLDTTSPQDFQLD